MNPHGDVLEQDARLRAGLAALWERSRATHLEAAAVIVEYLAAPDCPGSSVSDASGAAHRLAGTLGIFGLPDASELARFIEECLDERRPSTAPPPASELLAVAMELRDGIAGHVLACG